MRVVSYKSLAECGVEIISGQIMSRIALKGAEGEAAEKRRVIIPKCILPDGSIEGKDLPEEELKAEADPKYLTEAGNIVMKLSTPYDAARVEESEAGCVVPSFCVIVRSSGELDPDYLLAFLNSTSCKGQLKNMVAGSVMAMLSIGKIRNAVVPVPSAERQKEIGKAFLKNRERIRIVKEIVRLETLKNDIAFRELENGHET